MSDVLSEGTDTYTGEQRSHAAMKIYVTEVVKNVQISSVPMSTKKKTRRYDPVVKNTNYLWYNNIVDKEIQIIDGDQKDDLPLRKVNIKKIFI